MKKTAAIILLLLTLSSIPARAEADAPKTSARCAILVHADTGAALFEKNADEKMLIASTTKIMTALVVIENCGLSDTVTIQDSDVRVEGSSMYLKVGREYTVEQLLYGMMLASGNDAAMALARHCGGDIESFAALMNARAVALDMSGSSFVNPHGLDAPGHMSTARDMAKLTTEALKNDTFRRIVSEKSYRVGDQVYKNHNKLLFNYEGALGVKTGYTKKAGRILVSAAERDGLRLICVTISDPDDWRDHAAMFDWGFSRFEWRFVTGQGEFRRLPVVSGTSGSVGIVADRELSVLLDRQSDTRLRVNLPRFVFAPLKKGKQAGSIQVIRGGEIIDEIKLYYNEDVKGAKKK